MRFGLVLDSVFEKHRNPAYHPEGAERISVLRNAIKSHPLSREMLFFPPSAAEREAICRVHSRELYERIRSTRGLEYSMLDPDTYTSEASFEVASLAAGSAIDLVRLLFAGEIRSGFALVRPPGHHAESDRAMGFCLFNNVAVAAQWALDNGFARRVAIVDFDVHHGNGTQEIFYSRDDVLYVSTHQYPFYPGTGAFSEQGSSAGLGRTVNFPLPGGKGDAFYEALHRELIVPVLREFQPDFLLVSAGYDAHRDDPLAGMMMTADGFGRISALLNRVALEICGGRILYVLEGGYDLRALAESVIRTMEAAINSRPVEAPLDRPAEFAAYRKMAAQTHGRYWACLSEDVRT